MATYKSKYTSAVFIPATIKLVAITYTLDSIGQSVASEQTNDRSGRIGSVSASEVERAGQNGYKAEYEAVVWSSEYNGELIAEYNGRRYQIYRQYMRSDGRTELYLGQRAGTNG